MPERESLRKGIYFAAFLRRRSCATLSTVDQHAIDAAFSAVSHAFPKEAEWQGPHFRYAVLNGVTIIETKKSFFEAIRPCDTCGQMRGQKESRFFYWLLVNERYVCISASYKSQFSKLRTVLESLKPSTNYLPAT